MLTYEAVSCVLNGLSFWSTEPDRLDEYYDKNRKITFRSQIESDRRKFPLADENGDGKLNREEMAVYLHPSDFPKMRDFVVDQYFDQMDENKDGRVTREEYLGQWACLSVCQSVCTFICLWLLYTHSSLCLSICFSVCLCLCFECVCESESVVPIPSSVLLPSPFSWLVRSTEGWCRGARLVPQREGIFFGQQRPQPEWIPRQSQ